MKKRCEVVYEQGPIHRMKVIVDKETCVYYIWASESSGEGMTVLLDSEL